MDRDPPPRCPGPPPARPAASPGPARPRRRRILRRVFLYSWLLLLALGAWGFLWEPSRLVERDYTLALPRWPAACNGLRLDVVADLHAGSPHVDLAKVDQVVDRLLASDSDAVVLAGDYVILSVLAGTYITSEEIAVHLRRLSAGKPVYAVLGNHDWWKDGPRVRRALESAGVVVLEDDARPVQARGCRFWMVGVGDLTEAPHDVGKAFATVTDDAPAVGVTHNPDLFPRMPARAALVIAGHTHGGQVRIPFYGSPLKRRHPFIAGEYVVEGRHVFVSTGIGTSILPLRFGVPPEISRLRLVGAPPDP